MRGCPDRDLLRKRIDVDLETIITRSERAEPERSFRSVFFSAAKLDKSAVEVERIERLPLIERVKGDLDALSFIKKATGELGRDAAGRDRDGRRARASIRDKTRKGLKILYLYSARDRRISAALFIS